MALSHSLPLCLALCAGLAAAMVCDSEDGQCEVSQQSVSLLQSKLEITSRSSWDDHDDEHHHHDDHHHDDHHHSHDDAAPSPPPTSPTPTPPTPPTPPTATPPTPPAPPPPTPPTPPTPPGSSPAWSYKPMTWTTNLASPFPIQPCASIKNANGALLSAQDRQSLASEKKTKCIQVFGILIAGTAAVNSNAMKLGANIVAQLLDPNCDGQVDDSNVAAKLSRFTNAHAPWFNFGTDHASEDSTMQPSASSQAWKAGAETSIIPGIVLEEAFHMVHQFGWAVVYPDAIGFKQWGNDKQSVACRCMRDAQCAWYQHPENGGCTNSNGTKCYNSEVTDVFKSGAILGTCSSGTCANPSCDCMEFFHKTYTTWLGNKYMGYARMKGKINEFKSQGLNQRAAIEKLLGQSSQCTTLLQHMKSATMPLPKTHIKETYQCGR